VVRKDGQGNMAFPSSWTSPDVHWHLGHQNAAGRPNYSDDWWPWTKIDIYSLIMCWKINLVKIFSENPTLHRCTHWRNVVRHICRWRHSQSFPQRHNFTHFCGTICNISTPTPWNCPPWVRRTRVTATHHCFMVCKVAHTWTPLPGRWWCVFGGLEWSIIPIWCWRIFIS